MDYIYKNSTRLTDIPIWAFHGAVDETVPVEETDRMIALLKGKNRHLKYTRMPDIGHWMHWSVYPGEDLYKWFLTHNKQSDD